MRAHTPMSVHTHFEHACIHEYTTNEKKNVKRVDIPSILWVTWRTFYRIKDGVRAEISYSPSFLPFFPFSVTLNTITRWIRCWQGPFQPVWRKRAHLCCHLPYTILYITYHTQYSTLPIASIQYSISRSLFQKTFSYKCQKVLFLSICTSTRKQANIYYLLYSVSVKEIEKKSP